MTGRTVRKALVPRLLALAAVSIVSQCVSAFTYRESAPPPPGVRRSILLPLPR